MLRTTILPALSALFALTQIFAAGGATAQSASLKAGTLTCNSDGTVGLVVGSNEQLSCSYVPVGGGAATRFAGKTSRVGLDVGIRGASVTIWTVLASTTEVPGDRLEGTFGGVSADVAAGLGVGANVLVGGNDKSIVLQPVSVKGEVGLNVSLGVSSLTLTEVR